MVRTTAKPPARPAVRAPTRLSRWVLLCAGAEAVGMTAAAGAARAATALAPRRTALAWGLVVAAGLGLLMGGVLGAAQAGALRGTVARPWRWVGVSAVAWTPAMVVIFAGATAAPAAWSDLADVALGACTGALAGAVLGAVS